MIKFKKALGIGLSAFALFIGSVGLTGCETGGEVEEEVEEGELEEEIEEEDD